MSIMALTFRKKTAHLDICNPDFPILTLRQNHLQTRLRKICPVTNMAQRDTRLKQTSVKDGEKIFCCSE